MLILKHRCFTDTFGNILSVAFNPYNNDYLVAGTTTGEIRSWDIRGLPLPTFRGHTNWVRSVAFSSDGKLLASGSDYQTVRLWEVSSGQCCAVLQAHTSAVYSVAFSSNGKLLATSGSSDQMVCLWEVASNQCLATLQDHIGGTYSVAFNPDGKTIASGSYDGTINLWDWQAGICIQKLKSDRPYERMNITHVKGLTETQKAALKSLGAIEDEE